MSTLYLVALGGFCLALLALLVDTVVGVSRKPVWHAFEYTAAVPAMAPVPAIVPQTMPAASRPAVVAALPITAVDARHSSFDGLINHDEFQLTA